jgi:hypothetical protein
VTVLPSPGAARHADHLESGALVALLDGVPERAVLIGFLRFRRQETDQLAGHFRDVVRDSRGEPRRAGGVAGLEYPRANVGDVAHI